MDGDVKEGKLEDIVRTVGPTTAINRIIEDRIQKGKRVKAQSVYGVVIKIEDAISSIDCAKLAHKAGDFGSHDAALQKARHLLLEILEIPTD